MPKEITRQEVAEALAENNTALAAAIAEAIKAANKPETMGSFAESYWAERGKAVPTSNAEASDDISDLVPPPMSTSEAWERYHASARESMANAAASARRGKLN